MVGKACRVRPGVKEHAAVGRHEGGAQAPHEEARQNLLVVVGGVEKRGQGLALPCQLLVLVVQEGPLVHIGGRRRHHEGDDGADGHEGDEHVVRERDAPLARGHGTGLPAHAVADAADRLDEVRALAQLGADLLDVDVDGARAPVEVPAPDPLKQRLSREDHAGRPHEEL